VRQGAPTPRRSRLAGRYDLGERYDGEAYSKAVGRACDWAGVPRWAPNQLRHSAATLLAEEFGPLVAQTILGHASLRTTEIYAARSLEGAIAAIAKTG
jgi:integrase